MYNLFKKLKPLFDKGGKLHSLFYVYEALEAFMWVTPKRTKNGAHIRDPYDMKRLMIVVVLAGLPAFLFGIYNVGYQHYMAAGMQPKFFYCIGKGLLVVLPIYIITLAAGGFWEVLFAAVRKHEINEGFLVTSFLIPMIVPPTLPWWQLVIAVSFGIVIGKEVFGGVGMNIFNPALVTRAFLFFAYPKSLSGDSVWTLFPHKIVDAYTSATPLAVAASGANSTITESLYNAGYRFHDMFFGLIPGSIGETSTLAILLGAILLIVTGVGSWRIISSVFAGGILMAFILNYFAPTNSHFMSLPFHYHLVTGGFAFGAVFMATDPVSASGTNFGKFIYGFLIGCLAILIRVLNPAYPEGMMLAILFMNLFSPLIDYFVLASHKKRRLQRASL